MKNHYYACFLITSKFDRVDFDMLWRIQGGVPSNILHA